MSRQESKGSAHPRRGLLSGAAAMSFRKGSRGHGLAGNVFFVSMMTMAGCGALMAVLKHQTTNIFGGLLTLYPVSTAWATVRRRQEANRIYDWAGIPGRGGDRRDDFDLWICRRRESGRGKRRGSRRDVFRAELGGAAVGCRRPSRAPARRRFRQTTNRSTPLAYVLWALYCFGVDLPGPFTPFSGEVAANARDFPPGDPAPVPDDFLAGARALHESLSTEPVAAHRRVLGSGVAIYLYERFSSGIVPGISAVRLSRR